jgi:hypothetical protein
MQCEINSKQEDDQIQVLTNDLKEFRDKTSVLHKQVRELQLQIE